MNQEGSSKWVSKELMISGYWGLKPFAKILIASRVSANTVSSLGLGLGFLSGVTFGFGHFGFGSIFLIISGIFDVLDGMVARMSKRIPSERRRNTRFSSGSLC